VVEIRVLVNTGISELLNNSIAFFKKIELIGCLFFDLYTFSLCDMLLLLVPLLFLCFSPGFLLQESLLPPFVLFFMPLLLFSLPSSDFLLLLFQLSHLLCDISLGLSLELFLSSSLFFFVKPLLII
jgi:hypothetical protein